MRSLSYIYSRVLRKLRGSAIQNSHVHSSSKIESGSVIVNSSFDRHSFCGYDCTFLNTRVGAFCSISNDVVVGGARHPIEYVSTSPVFLSHKDSVKTKLSRHVYSWAPETHIGNDVWIGERVLIKGGVSIGDGAVIGMGSVITKDVPAYSIVGGNPAKLIRRRFSDEVIAALERLQWWSLSDEEITAMAPLFVDPVALLKEKGLL